MLFIFNSILTLSDKIKLMRNIFTLLSLLITGVLLAQAPTDWIHLSSDQGYNGVATEQAYKYLEGKTANTVVVAIIDSGVDIEHEDLKNNIWVNKGEIPDNGIDDDGNGYIDDVNGWNFIGGPKGNVNHDTYEVTRLYKKLKYKYEDANESQLSKTQLAEYKKFKMYEEEVMGKREKAMKSLDNIKDSEMRVLSAISALEKALDGRDMNENLDSLDLSDPEVDMAVQMVKRAKADGAEIPTVENLRTEVLDQFVGAKDHYSGQKDFSYNPDFDPRPLVGDDYSNGNEMYYGNNDVEGPDALHGTHVAGIVAAERGNDLGMDGIADHVEIMSIRTVPNGDERDKDVANAIRYAVDNGASIINMSFGKGFSWDKEIVDAAVKHATKNDVLLIHAAGNSAQNNDNTDNFPNDTYDKKGLFKPKSSKNWIEVGALSYKKGEDLSATFSNYGAENVDIFAPGVAVYSTLPDNQYRPLQGTSMAAPVVAGVAALLRSYYPSLSATQVKDLLMSSSVKLNDTVKVPGTDDKMPFSKLSVSGGTVNAFKAVSSAASVKGKSKKYKKKMKNKTNVTRA